MIKGRQNIFLGWQETLYFETLLYQGGFLTKHDLIKFIEPDNTDVTLENSFNVVTSDLRQKLEKSGSGIYINYNKGNQSYHLVGNAQKAQFELPNFYQLDVNWGYDFRYRALVNPNKKKTLRLRSYASMMFEALIKNPGSLISKITMFNLLKGSKVHNNPSALLYSAHEELVHILNWSADGIKNRFLVGMAGKNLMYYGWDIN
jgi:hypothetical protein